MRVRYGVRLPGPFYASTSHRLHATSGFAALAVGVLRLFWWAIVVTVQLVVFAAVWTAHVTARAYRRAQAARRG